MDIYDGLALAGVLALSVGAGLIYAPAGLIVMGLGLLVAGLLGARIRARK